MKDLIAQWNESPEIKGGVSRQPGHDRGARKRKAKAGGIEVFDVDGAWSSTREHEDDGTFGQMLHGSAKLKVREIAVDAEGTPSVEIVSFDARGALLYGESDLRAAFEGAFASPAPVLTFSTPHAWAARLGDPTAHGTSFGPGLGSTSVFIEGQPALRAALDFHVCPGSTGTTPHVGGAVAPGAMDVFIDGFPAVRVGDAVLEAGGPNPIVSGASQVEIGAPPPPVVHTPISTGHDESGEDWRFIEIEVEEARVEGSVGLLRGEAKLAYSNAKGLGASKGKVDASVLQGKLTNTYRIRLFGDWASILVGGSAELRVLTAGLESSSGLAGRGAGWFGFVVEPVVQLERTRPP